MSIWVSIGEPVSALDGDSDDAIYRAEGEPTVKIDVAIAEGYHDHVRVAVWNEAAATHMDAILSPGAVRDLIQQLGNTAPGMTVTYNQQGIFSIEKTR